MQSGDTFISLAVEYGVTPAELASKNCLDEDSSLAVGMTLYLPGDTPLPASTTTRTPTATEACGPPRGWDDDYVVQRGDTLFSIATRYQTTVAALQQANCLGSSTTIIAGRRLYVPNNPTITPTKTEKPTATKTPTMTATETATEIIDSPTTFTNVTPAPKESVECSGEFGAEIIDDDGIVEAKIQFSSDDTFSSILLQEKVSYTEGDYYGFYEDLSSLSMYETLYWRYLVIDNNKITSYYSPGSFILNCGTPVPK